MRPNRKHLAAAVPAIAAVMLVTGCAETTVPVSIRDDRATLAPGETLEVDFGHVNPSVGDGWYLVDQPEPSVLSDLGDELNSRGKQGKAGTGGDMTWRFEAVDSGTSTLRFQYCFRTDLANCQGHNKPAPPPVEIAVTVR